MEFIIKIITRLFWIEIDYAYILLLQFKGVLRPLDPSRYRFLNAKQPNSVILIPGVYETWQMMQPIADKLVRKGYRVHVLPELGYNRNDIESVAASVERYIKKHNLTDCVIVAHSKGGLVGKYLLERSRLRSRIRGVIGLNVPFAGSSYAQFVPFRAVKVFAPSSDMMKKLRAQSTASARIVSIYSRFDPHIPKGSRLEGADNIEVPVHGHFLILNNSNVHEQIMDKVALFFTAKRSKQPKKQGA